MSSTARTGAVVALAGSCLAGVLTGCGLDPPEGVRVDRHVVGDLGREPQVRRLPSGPLPGQSAEQVVRGFLGAAAEPDGGHALARRFLTRENVWDDTAGAIVYRAGTLAVRPEPEQVAAAAPAPPRTVRVDVDQVAVLASDGSFLPAAGHVSLSVTVRQVRGEWRIDRAPAGLLLSSRDLVRGYRPVARYLLAPHQDTLVPDPAYVVGTGSTLAGAAVRAEVAAPVGWLAPAVRTAVPAGLKLLGSVVVTDGVATVDLDRVAFGVPPQQRRMLVDQFAATLGTVPGVERVAVLVEGRAYLQDEPTVPAGVPAASGPRASGPAYLVGGQGELRSLPALSAVPETPSGLTAVAPDPSGSGALAALPGSAPSRVLVGRPGALATVALPAAAETAPSWIPGAGPVVGTADGTLRLVCGDGSVVPIARFSPAGGIREVAVSPDGTRIAVRTTAGTRPDTGGKTDEAGTGGTGTGTGNAVWLGRLVRSGSSAVAEGWVPWASGLDDISALAWTSPLDVVMAGRRGAAPGLWQVTLGRLADPERLPTNGLPAQPDSVAAAPGRGLLAMAAGHAWRQDGPGWSDLGPARAVAAPH